MQAANSSKLPMNPQTPPAPLLLLVFACSCSAFGRLPIVPFPAHMLAPIPENLVVDHATPPQLRAMLTVVSFANSRNAARALVRAGDDATIQRLVYALKQGNGPAAEILYEGASLQVVPYLLEDVAHGSMAHFTASSLSSFDRVRVSAAEIMAETLSKIPGLPAESTAWLKDVARCDGRSLMLVPEKSKVLLDWWDHNGEAVLAGRASEAMWLPVERTITPRTYEAWWKKHRAKPPPPPPSPPPIPRDPPSELPVQVDEPFESWASRIVDPKRRDVTWATVDYENGTSVKPDNREMRPADAPGKAMIRGYNQSGLPSQASSSSSNAIAAKSEAPSSTPWSVVAMLVVVSVGLLWLLIMKRN